VPIEIRDVDGGLGNIITKTGEITEPELLAAMRRHMTEDMAKFARYRYSLGDWSGATLVQVSSRAIQTVAGYCRHASEHNADAVVALVSPTGLVYGLARMWMVYVEETSWETSLFRNHRDARTWLGERVSESFGIEGLTFR